MEKKKPGQPTKFSESYIPQLIKLCEIFGATDKQIAAFYDVTEQTINNWKLQQPKFFESLKLAKEVADNTVVQSLYKRAVGFKRKKDVVIDGAPLELEEELPPDPTSCIFWLKNRKPQEWRDKVEQEHTGGINISIVEKK